MTNAIALFICVAHTLRGYQQLTGTAKHVVTTYMLEDCSAQRRTCYCSSILSQVRAPLNCSAASRSRQKDCHLLMCCIFGGKANGYTTPVLESGYYWWRRCTSSTSILGVKKCCICWGGPTTGQTWALTVPSMCNAALSAKFLGAKCMEIGWGICYPCHLVPGTHGKWILLQV